VLLDKRLGAPQHALASRVSRSAWTAAVGGGGQALRQSRCSSRCSSRTSRARCDAERQGELACDSPRWR